MKTAKIIWKVEIVNFHGDVQYYETAYKLPDGQIILIRESPAGEKIITID